MVAVLVVVAAVVGVSGGCWWVGVSVVGANASMRENGRLDVVMTIGGSGEGGGGRGVMLYRLQLGGGIGKVMWRSSVPTCSTPPNQF